MATATVAHEGNPQYSDDLVVVGTLDGNAYVQFQFDPKIQPINVTNPEDPPS